MSICSSGSHLSRDSHSAIDRCLPKIDVLWIVRFDSAEDVVAGRASEDSADAFRPGFGPLRSYVSVIPYFFLMLWSVLLRSFALFFTSQSLSALPHISFMRAC